MTKAKLTAERLRSMLHYEPETGVWRWLDGDQLGAKKDGTVGCFSRGYHIIGVGRAIHSAHRLAWLYMTGDWPAKHIDHIDGNKSNNAWKNLRDVPRTVNLQNRHRADVDSSTGLLGVSTCGHRWKADIRANGKRVSLGVFDTPELAHAAYLAAKRELHPEAPIAQAAGPMPERNRYPVGKSGVRGVRKINNRWAAHVWKDGRQVHLGMFATIDEAASAVERMASMYADPRGVEAIKVRVK
jgi:hypothetical protein